MGHNDSSYEMTDHDKAVDVRVHEKHAGRPVAPVPATIESQTRVRRLFSTAQIFMFSLTYMGLWFVLLEDQA